MAADVLRDPLREAAAGEVALQPALPLVCRPELWRPDLVSHDLWTPADFGYSKKRERLLNEDVMGKFLEKLIGVPEVKLLLSDEHFSVDGTLLQTWPSYTSLKRIDGKEDPPLPPIGHGEGFAAPKEGEKRAKGDFPGVRLSGDTHHSEADHEALLTRKSNIHPAQLIYRGHAL